MDHVYKQIHGWFFADWLYREQVAAAVDGAHFVEVGAWKGQSAAFMAVEIANSGKRITFDVVDNFIGDSDPKITAELPKDKPLASYFAENMTRFALWPYVRMVGIESPRAARLYDDGEIDFVYIDGSHYYEAVKADINAWLPKVKPGGLLAGDDYRRPDVEAVLEHSGHVFWTDGQTWKIEK